MPSWGKLVLGAVLALIGLVWTLQGLNLLGGSGMSGQPVWAVIGVVLIAVGAWLASTARGSRRTR